MVDRAVCENGTFFNATTVISVTRLDPSVAKYMNLHLSRDGLVLTQEGVDLTSVYSTADLQNASEKSALIQRRTGSRRGVTTRGKYEVDEPASTTSGSSSSSDSNSNGETEDSSIYLKPNRTKSICTKLMEYFFSY